MTRPSVSLIVPFAGTETELQRLLADVRRVRLARGDEVIIADNRGRHAGTASDRDRSGLSIVDATGARAAGFARNCAARTATGEWLLFIDADTQPPRSLLDDYFDPPPADTTGILAGAIEDLARPATLAARHSVARGHMSQVATLARAAAPYAQTANCAIRRSAFEQAGGFEVQARAGEDADLCFRLADAGWRLEQRPQAVVLHRGRATVASKLAQLSRHGSGAGWLNRRHPGSFPPPRPWQLTARLARNVQEAIDAARRRDRESAAFALLDLAGACAFELGRLRSNRPRRN